HYHKDVLKYVNDSLEKAKDLLKPIVAAKDAIEAEFDNRPIDEETFTELKNQVDKIGSDDFREALKEHIDLTEQKQDVLDELEQKGQDKIDEVKNTEGLSEEEKADEVKRIEDAIEDAKDAVENADKSSQVDKALKDLAKEELEIKAALTEKLIDKLTEVSKAERDKAKEDVADALADAIAKVDAAKRKDAIDTAVTDGKTAIDAIYDALKETNTSVKDAKKDAKEALDQEAETAKSAVDALDGLSKEEKDAKKDQIDQALNEAKDQVDEATSTNAVEKAKNDGSLAIEKEKGKAEIDAAEKLGLEELEDLNLEDEDRADKEQAIKDAADDARDIDDASTKEEVATEVQVGKDDIADILKDAQLADIKNNAKEDVESKAQAAIDNIEARDDLSEDEKEKLVKEINDAKDTAITGIDKASSETGVNEAVSRAEDQFDLAKDKAGAIESIKAEAKETKESIEGTANLEEDEINQRTSEVDTHAEDAIKEVLNATTKNAIENAVDAVSLEMHKTDAKAGIDAHRNKGLADLENLDNLTEEEKEDLSDRIEQVRKGVLEKVDEATSKKEES